MLKQKCKCGAEVKIFQYIKELPQGWECPKCSKALATPKEEPKAEPKKKRGRKKKKKADK